MTGFYRLVARVLIVSMAWMPFSLNAAMVGTGEIVAGAPQDAGRDTLTGFLSRDEVVRLLEGMGLSAADARDRVGALTADEVRQLANRIDSLPAGGMDGWLWVIVIVAVMFYLLKYKN